MFQHLRNNRSIQLFLLSATLSSASSLMALAKETVIFDHKTQTDTSAFKMFLEGPLAMQGRPQLVRNDQGLSFSPGSGGFTLWKFADLTSQDFDLKLRFQIPPGIRYSNSGVYFLYQDPTIAVPNDLPTAVRVPFLAALQSAKARSDRFGKGPYEADFFAHELQIIAGFENGLPAENHGVGAFYGIDPVSMVEAPVGKQNLVPYDAFIGDTYELTVESRGERMTTFMRSVSSQPTRVQVADYKNPSKDQDPIRGGKPTALLLQGFPNNGTDVKSPVFERITLDLKAP